MPENQQITLKNEKAKSHPKPFFCPKCNKRNPDLEAESGTQYTYFKHNGKGYRKVSTDVQPIKPAYWSCSMCGEPLEDVPEVDWGGDD